MQPIQTLSIEILSQQGQKQFEARISGQLLPNSDLQKTNQRGHFCHFWVKATALRAGVSSERQKAHLSCRRWVVGGEWGSCWSRVTCPGPVRWEVHPPSSSRKVEARSPEAVAQRLGL